jgi:hypothetical protein
LGAAGLNFLEHFQAAVVLKHEIAQNQVKGNLAQPG